MSHIIFFSKWVCNKRDSTMHRQQMWHNNTLSGLFNDKLTIHKSLIIYLPVFLQIKLTVMTKLDGRVWKMM